MSRKKPPRLKDIPDGKILKPQREHVEFIPIMCGKCGTGGATKRRLIHEEILKKTIIRAFKIDDVKCHGCGEWLNGTIEKETHTKAKITAEEGGGLIIPDKWV